MWMTEKFPIPSISANPVVRFCLIEMVSNPCLANYSRARPLTLFFLLPRFCLM
jgi:hypothetical protein